MAPKDNAPDPVNLHPIKVVARRTGLTPDVIRVWERRYHAVEPRRAKGRRRLYTDEEVERLSMLRKVTRAGRRIRDVASLSDEELRTMVAEDERAAATVAEIPPSRGRHRSRSSHVDEAIRAVEALDGEALERTLLRASVELSETALLDDVVAPLLRRVGDRWHDGTLRVMHEHLTSAVVRSMLGAARAKAGPPPGAPAIVVTTPAGQVHELGALMVALSASREGWRVTYLGSDIPAEEIAAAALQSEARVVALSLVHPADDPRVADELERLRRSLGDRIAIVAGGRAVGGYRQVLSEIGAIVPADLPELRAKLEELRLQPAG